MKEHTITHKTGKTIFVTEMRQFTLPSAVHLHTLHEAARRDGARMVLDLYGFNESTSVWAHSTDRAAREYLVGRMLDWLKRYGVYVGTGIYFETTFETNT
jgi:hypothetical protein